MTNEEAWQAAERILCIRLDSLGDVLMTTPALRALKEAHPRRAITLLTSRAGAKAAPLIPEVDEVLVYDAPWMKATPSRTDSSQEYRIASFLRAAGFDAAVVFTVFSQNPLPAAMLAYLAEIPLRLAYCRENPYQLLTDWVSDPDLDHCNQIRHEVRRHLDLVATVGCTTKDETLSMRVSNEAEGRVRDWLRGLGVDLNRGWVVIHPGASASSRRYPADGFAQVARSLTRDHGLQVVFSGGAEEARLVCEIQDAMGVPSFSMAGLMNLEEMAALLFLSPLLLSNNTGPVHVAAAMGTPVVDLYALTNPQHTPWGVPHRVLSHDVPCKYCYKSVCPMGHHDCLRLVEPASVVQATIELFQETGVLHQRQGVPL